MPPLRVVRRSPNSLLIGQKTHHKTTKPQTAYKKETARVQTKHAKKPAPQADNKTATHTTKTPSQVRRRTAAAAKKIRGQLRLGRAIRRYFCSVLCVFRCVWCGLLLRLGCGFLCAFCSDMGGPFFVCGRGLCCLVVSFFAHQEAFGLPADNPWEDVYGRL